MPLEATQHTADGAKAFAEFFVHTIDWGFASTSSTYMRHYFVRSCEGCRIFADGIDAAARAHHHFIGGRFTVKSASALSANEVVVLADNSSFEEVDSHGRAVKADIAHLGERFHLRLTWEARGWSVNSQEIEA